MLSAACISELLGEYDEDNDLEEDDAPESEGDSASDSEHDWVPPVLELLESNSAGSSADVSTSVASVVPVETKTKRAAPTSFERKNALLRHQLHVNTLLIRCLQRSAMCDYSELAATLLSCVPPHLIDLNPSTLTIASLHEVVSWFHRAILLAPTSTELSVSCSTNVSRIIECGARQLLQCWQSRQADAEQIALLGVSALRSLGIPARLVCALQPLSSKFTEQAEQARKATEALKSQGLLKYWNVTTNQFDNTITEDNESAIAEVVCTSTPCLCAKFGWFSSNVESPPSEVQTEVQTTQPIRTAATSCVSPYFSQSANCGVESIPAATTASAGSATTVNADEASTSKTPSKRARPIRGKTVTPVSTQKVEPKSSAKKGKMQSRKKSGKRKRSKSSSESSESEETESDEHDDFEAEVPAPAKARSKGRRLTKASSPVSTSSSVPVTCWAEVWLESAKRYVVVDFVGCAVDTGDLRSKSASVHVVAVEPAVLNAEFLGLLQTVSRSSNVRQAFKSQVAHALQASTARKHPSQIEIDLSGAIETQNLIAQQTHSIAALESPSVPRTDMSSSRAMRVYCQRRSQLWSAQLHRLPAAVPRPKSVLIDVSTRYCAVITATANKGRQDVEWISKALSSWSASMTGLSKEQTSRIQIDQQHLKSQIDQLEQVLPASIAAVKTHPRFCAERFVKKYETIYPLDAVVGEINGEKIYDRCNLHVLHTKEKWLRNSRRVRDDERPIKFVKTVGMSMRREREENAMTALFGKWQTDAWQPEAARDGIVPKNERGNVDLWDDSHLPGGCVHLTQPRIAATARKLGIDFAPAMVGFDVRQGRSIPIIDGIVICTEFSQQLCDAHAESERLRAERAEARRLLSISETWKKIISGVLARDYVQRQYNLVDLVADADAEVHRSGSATNIEPTNVPETTLLNQSHDFDI